jgi:hypothetical protein
VFREGVLFDIMKSLMKTHARVSDGYGPRVSAAADGLLRHHPLVQYYASTAESAKV